MQEEHNIDPVAQQELLERYRREAEDYDHVKEVKRRKQAQDMKVNGNIWVEWLSGDESEERKRFEFLLLIIVTTHRVTMPEANSQEVLQKSSYTQTTIEWPWSSSEFLF